MIPSDCRFRFKNGDSERAAAKLIRDKAYTMLQLLIDEVREYGKYVFRKDKEHLRNYMNPFYHTKKKSEEEAAEEVAELQSTVD